MFRDIKIATHKQEKEEIYKFRYQIYIEEMHRSCHADRENKVLLDSMDSEKSVLVYVKHINNQVIATARINYRRNSKFRFEEEYGIKEFLPYFPNFISNTSKLMIHKDYRHNRITLNFLNYLFKLVLKAGIVFDFIDCVEPLYKFYSKLGYRRYKNNFIHPEFGESVPMVLCLTDKKYLQKIGSPFHKILENYISSLDFKSRQKHLVSDPLPSQLLQQIISKNLIC
ncbi:MAG: GNAT family N-acetyltransferase [Nostoc indistinguendum CM1-VF10]|jgi:hypothetical protein|nr:GNAT family N-acetyltransferase [Nostoc indistinguendum CM1-VF10]